MNQEARALLTLTSISQELLRLLVGSGFREALVREKPGSFDVDLITGGKGYTLELQPKNYAMSLDEFSDRFLKPAAEWFKASADPSIQTTEPKGFGYCWHLSRYA